MSRAEDMSTKNHSIDVFLCGSLFDAPSVAAVRQALERSGLGVYSTDAIRPGARLTDDVRQAIAEAGAFVLVVNPEYGILPNMAVELGAAMAWRKRIIVLTTAAEPMTLPSYLSDIAVYPIGRVDDVVAAISRGRQPLSDADRALLAKLYAKMRVPTDRFVREPAVTDDLAHRFNKRVGREVTGERLVQELIRMRKAGDLPKLPRTTRAAV